MLGGALCQVERGGALCQVERKVRVPTSVHVPGYINIHYTKDRTFCCAGFIQGKDTIIVYDKDEGQRIKSGPSVLSNSPYTPPYLTSLLCYCFVKLQLACTLHFLFRFSISSLRSISSPRCLQTARNKAECTVNSRVQKDQILCATPNPCRRQLQYSWLSP